MTADENKENLEMKNWDLKKWVEKIEKDVGGSELKKMKFSADGQQCWEEERTYSDERDYWGMWGCIRSTRKSSVDDFYKAYHTKVSPLKKLTPFKQNELDEDEWERLLSVPYIFWSYEPLNRYAVPLTVICLENGREKKGAKILAQTEHPLSQWGEILRNAKNRELVTSIKPAWKKALFDFLEQVVKNYDVDAQYKYIYENGVAKVKSEVVERDYWKSVCLKS